MGQASRTVLFSGGGSAGHLAPGFALAEALQARGVHTLFATPGEAVETAWFHGRPRPARIPAWRLPRTLLRAVPWPLRLARGVLAARRILKRERVAGVIALGGWPCVPAVLAARMRRLPLAFLVPDAVPGLVVRRFARWAARVYVAHPEVAASLGVGERARLVGPLIRAQVGAGRRDPSAFGLRADRRTLLVTGGSLGARGLDEAFLAGLEAAVVAEPALAERIQVLHAVGQAGLAAAGRYEALGVVHHVVAYLEDMGTAYRTADLVLCRAGANTCAELRALGVPAVLVPYPHHADRQQFRNAAPLVASGGARLIEEADLTPARVRADVLDLLEDEASLRAMQEALESETGGGAAESADDWIRFLGEEASSDPRT